MDVHPPHEPVHSWRDALIHIGLMTVGLFIALMMEAGVESLHHRELVREARENIRREMEENHTNADKDVADLQQSGDKIKAGVETLRFIEKHRQARNQTISFAVNFENLDDAAWRTARDTGALGFMPLEEVQRYAAIYGEQSSVMEQLQRQMQQQAEALAPIFASGEDADFDAMPAQDFADMRKEAGRNYADVYVLEQVLKQLSKEYEEALQQK